MLIKEMKNASYTNESIASHLSCWNVFMKCLLCVLFTKKSIKAKVLCFYCLSIWLFAISRIVKALQYLKRYLYV